MEKYFIAAIGGAEHLGNKRIKMLMDYFGSAEVAWNATETELSEAGLRGIAFESFTTWRKIHPDAPDNLMNYCDKKDIKICSVVDEDYPSILKEINPPPAFFYYRGKLQPLAKRIGIVGTRDNTNYGEKVAFEFGRELAKAGLTVVSGAAHGIDSFAHRGALKTGRTVAVLGHGLNWVYPTGNKNLINEIAENGLIMSEFAPNVRPSASTFPTRNRIIAGLCLGIIVVEAGEKSGALITSDFAATYGRDVFAIPGEIYAKKSVGCNELIQDGAMLIKNAKDILEFYNISNDKNNSKEFPINSEPIKLDGIVGKVFETIPAKTYITSDEILNKVDELKPNELPKIILSLELKGCITTDSAGRCTRKI